MWQILSQKGVGLAAVLGGSYLNVGGQMFLLELRFSLSSCFRYRRPLTVIILPQSSPSAYAPMSTPILIHTIFTHIIVVSETSLLASPSLFPSSVPYVLYIVPPPNI